MPSPWNPAWSGPVPGRLAGVKIDLVAAYAARLRLRASQANIKVRAILQVASWNTRVYCFHNNGKRELYCASADWMERNFFPPEWKYCFITQKKLRVGCSST